MHLHAGHQKGASVESHIYNASLLGMKYVRITSHDLRTGIKKHEFNEFDFSKGEASYQDFPWEKCGWETSTGSPEISYEDGCMILRPSSADNNCHTNGICLVTSDKRHSMSLLADVTLTLGVKTIISGKASVIIDVTLSQRPPDHENAHIWYYFGAEPDNVPPHTAFIKLCEKDDGLYELKLTEDAQKDGICDVIGGLDNAFTGISFVIQTKVSSYAECRFDTFKVSRKYDGDEVVKKQRLIADEVGKKYGIKPYVTTEISGAGQHKNVYSTCVPVIDYTAHNFNITQMEAIEHVKKHGGMFCYNHPLSKYGKMTLTKEEIDFIVQRDAVSLISSRVFGADLMEVGFVEGRAGFNLDEYLRLWDLIGMGGVFISGSGDSDSHNGKEKWFEGQNFASWIAAPEDVPFPVPEKVFNDSMKAGRMYLGDPVYLKNPVNLECEGRPMGAIVTIGDRDKKKRTLTFTANQPEKDNTVKIVINGQRISEYKASDLLDDDGNLTLNFDIEPTLTVNLARVEMYNKDGRCVMVTNPIYFVREAEYAHELPSYRLYDECKEN